MFSYEFSYEILNSLPQNRCFVPGFRQFSSHLAKCHACLATAFAPCRHLTQPWQCDSHKNTQRDTSKVQSAVPATQNDDGHVQSAAPATKTATHLAKTPRKYCACHTKRLSTHYKTRLNVTKCHACHAKRSNATIETSKNDPFCRSCHRHGHMALMRMVANGCGRLRLTVANGCEHKRNVKRTHPQPPDPHTETGPCYAFGKKHPNNPIHGFDAALHLKVPG